MQSGQPRITKNTFCDNLVVELYFRLQNEETDDSHSDDDDGNTSNFCDITPISVAIAHESRFFVGRRDVHFAVPKQRESALTAQESHCYAKLP